MNDNQIASRIYTHQTNGEEVVASIHQPIYSDVEDSWQCRVSLHGGGVDTEASVCAVDSLQAIVLAIRLLKTEIKLTAKELSWDDSPDILCGLE